MHLLTRGRMWIAGAAGVVGIAVLAGGALALTAAAAGPPAGPSGDYVAVARSCPPPPTPSPQEIARSRSELAAKLAQALGKTPQQVESALGQLENQKPPQNVKAGVTVQFGSGEAGADPLQEAAQKLGVTPQALKQALGSAITALPCPGAPGRTGETPDLSGFEAAVAQALGHGITAEQVRAALGGFLPGVPVAGHMAKTVVLSFLPSPENIAKLAAALGVTQEALQAALTQIGMPVLSAVACTAPAQPAVPAGATGEVTITYSGSATGPGQ